MKILVYSNHSAATVRAVFGAPQYSYHFVLKGFLPALELLGEVVHVLDPETEVDAIYDACLDEKQDCVFLCFVPPHLVPVTLRCPTIPIFAWEFTTIPQRMWNDDPRSDWRTVFRHCGRAIALSRHTARLVKEAMGADYPVFAIPTASYDHFAPLFHLKARARSPREVKFRGTMFDSDLEAQLHEFPLWPPVPAVSPPPPPPPSPPAPPPVLDLPPPRRGARLRLSLTLAHGLAWYRDVVRDLLPGRLKIAISAAGGAGHRFHKSALRPARPIPVIADPPLAKPAAAPEPEPEPEDAVQLSDIVFVTVISPMDGRKNWHDLLTAFLWAFRNEKRATLVLKMPYGARAALHASFYDVLARFAPFDCRVMLIYGYLDDTEYAALVSAADIYFNASSGEGLCIPLVEFLSAGVPAIAPDYTGMADYITPQMAFVLRASLEHNVWPFDPLEMFGTMRYRLDWSSLEEAFREAFEVALLKGGAYARMAQAAHEAMREYCPVERVKTLLAIALDTPATLPAREAAE